MRTSNQPRCSVASRAGSRGEAGLREVGSSTPGERAGPAKTWTCFACSMIPMPAAAMLEQRPRPRVLMSWLSPGAPATRLSWGRWAGKQWCCVPGAPGPAWRWMDHMQVGCAHGRRSAGPLPSVGRNARLRSWRGCWQPTPRQCTGMAGAAAAPPGTRPCTTPPGGMAPCLHAAHGRALPVGQGAHPTPWGQGRAAAVHAPVRMRPRRLWGQRSLGAIRGGGLDNRRSGDGACCPPLACGRAGHVDCVRLLLQSGAAVDAATKGGGTSVHRAAFAGHLEVVELL